MQSPKLSNSHLRKYEIIYYNCNNFREILLTWMELVELGHVEEFLDETGLNMCKHMILALIGLWTSQKYERLVAYQSESGEDVPGLVKAKTYSDTRTLSFNSTRILDTRTMLPLALQCKFQEVLLVEMAARILEKIPAAIPLAARVDGIYFAVRNPDQLNEVEALAAHHTYSVSQRQVFCPKNATS